MTFRVPGVREVFISKLREKMIMDEEALNVVLVAFDESVKEVGRQIALAVAAGGKRRRYV